MTLLILSSTPPLLVPLVDQRRRLTLILSQVTQRLYNCNTIAFILNYKIGIIAKFVSYLLAKVHVCVNEFECVHVCQCVLRMCV